MWFPTSTKLKELRTPSQILEFTLLPEELSLGVEGQGCVWPAQHCSFDLTSTLHLSCTVTRPRDRNCWLRWRHQSCRLCCPKVRVEQHAMWIESGSSCMVRTLLCPFPLWLDLCALLHCSLSLLLVQIERTCVCKCAFFPAVCRYSACVYDF